jgi:hypothetical protein
VSGKQRSHRSTDPAKRARSGPLSTRSPRHGRVLLAFTVLGMLVAMAVALAAPAAPAAKVKAGGQISGTVYSHTGATSAGATVTAYTYREDPPGSSWWKWLPLTSTTTRRDGTYTLSGLAAGTYRLLFLPANRTADAFEAWTEDDGAGPPPSGYDYWGWVPDYADDLVIATDQSQTGVDVHLDASGHIVGTVRDESGAGVAGVRVGAEFQAVSMKSIIYSTLTDAGGNYDLAGLPPGSWEPSAYDPSGWHQSVFWVPTPIAAAGETVTRDFDLQTAGKVSGTLVDQRGRAAPYVQVGAWQYLVEDPEAGDGYWTQVGDFTFTDKKGRYTLGGLPEGDVRIGFTDDPPTRRDMLGVTDPDWRYARAFYSTGAAVGPPAVELATAVAVTAGHATSGIDETVTSNVGTIAGVVTDDTGAPTKGIGVTAYWTDGSGWYGVTDGSSAGYTGDSGYYVIYGMPYGTYRLGFDDWEHWPLVYMSEFYDDAGDVESATSVPLGPAGTTPASVDVSVARYAHITGTVTGDGDVSSVNVEAYSYEQPPGEEGWWQQQEQTWIEPDGSYSLALVPGDYIVCFRDGAQTLATEYYPDAAWPGTPEIGTATVFTVAAGETVPAVDVDLVLGGAISGYVTGSDTGNPLEVQVSAMRYLDGEWRAVAEFDTQGSGWEPGDYRLGGLPPGDYVIFFRGDSQNLYAGEMWNDVPAHLGFGAADLVAVAAGDDLTSRNAVLALKTPPSP